ncbi:hemolysin XhlA family protein [Ligilactobacillus sp. WILCCON 0076]|uniref:Hemolysin XhlA family protein n=1 Tax=Ligilactobacillus ubinensis TaxID=2876789 RepID=A0A9X2JLS5_9LACO|nr:hemolysin XhlA family protein [Ligilactobacillus ubinensis]MCP0886920.1 hemolysin XhlA family protein [Ligilactobacillus ubinensis]
MPEKDDVNVIGLLMDIQQRLAKVETNTSGINDTAKKAEDAYNLSKQNESDINDLKSNSTWWQRTMWVAIILPVALFLIEQLLANK